MADTTPTLTCPHCSKKIGLYGASEVSEHLGIERSNIYKLKQPKRSAGLPEAAVKPPMNRGDVWLADSIRKWARRRKVSNGS